MILKSANCFQEHHDTGSVLGRALNEVAARNSGSGDLVSFCWDHKQYYLPEQPSIRLLALVQKTPTMAQAHVVITDQLLIAESWLESENANRSARMNSTDIGREVLDRFAERCEVPVLELDAPINLVPVTIPKPWGREIWYTGIEARGLSGLGDNTRSIPLPWLLALAGDRVLGAGCQAINLLKILDPRPEPVYGDLYLELHEKKREVYVVTHIDKTAWPEGVGAIRYGFDAQVQAEYSSDEAFRQAFQTSIADYEHLRRKIDDELDAAGEDKTENEAQVLPGELLARERSAREAMNRFTRLKPLRVGDVVKVPRLLPHSLQHGVRTVEFQTPVYERKILSFAQKVLTQNHWDTESAVELMTTTTPVENELTVLEQQAEYCRELIVEFEDFWVERLTLAPGGQWTLEGGTYYVLVMAVTPVLLGDRELSAESASLIPAQVGSVITNPGEEPAIVLISRPSLA